MGVRGLEGRRGDLLAGGLRLEGLRDRSGDGAVSLGVFVEISRLVGRFRGRLEREGLPDGRAARGEVGELVLRQGLGQVRREVGRLQVRVAELSLREPVPLAAVALGRERRPARLERVRLLVEVVRILETRQKSRLLRPGVVVILICKKEKNVTGR